MVFIINGKNINISEVNRGCVWKQYALCFIASLPFFTHGVESNNLTLSTHAGFFKSFDGVPWTTTALILASMLSTLPQCYAIDRFGRRFGVYLVVLLQGASCVPLLLPRDEIGDIILHILSGISTAGLLTCIPVYVREIATLESRGSMLSLMMLMTSAGYLVRLGMNSEEMLYLTVGLVISQFLLLVILLESPSYLVKVEKIEVARKNMSKLRCLPESDEYIESEVNRLKEESDRAKSNGSEQILRIFKNLIWRDEMKIGFVLYTTTVLSGSIIFLDKDKTLQQLNTSIDPEQILVPVCLFSGGFISVILLRLFERKYILTLATFIMVLSMGTLAVFTQSDLTIASLRWLPVVALGVLVFGFGMAWGIPAIIMVEIFNLEIRATVLGLIFTYSQILRLAHVHSFQYLEENIGIYTLFYIFSFVNLFAGVYSWSSVPNIKGKDVKHIERQMKRIPLIKL